MAIDVIVLLTRKDDSLSIVGGQRVLINLEKKEISWSFKGANRKTRTLDDVKSIRVIGNGWVENG